MKNIGLIILLLATFSLHTEAATVKISGSLKQFRMDRVAMHNDGIAAEVYNDKTTELMVDSNGMFSFEMNLKRPAYYKVGQNTLYLSPGDDLEIIFNRTTTKTMFKGKGEEANIYLQKCGQLSGWELFEIQKDAVAFEVYRDKIDSLATARLQELEALTVVDAGFKELETVRVKACRLNVYLDYFSVGRLSNWNDTQEVKQEKKKAFYQTIKVLADPLIQEIAASDLYLGLPEVRKALQECYATGIFTYSPSPAFRELVAVLEHSVRLDQGLMIKDHQLYTDFSRQIRNKDLQQSFMAKLHRRAELMEGRPAVDFIMKDTAGKEIKLSNFKGKMLFIDFWATWCLPCLAQIPAFEELSGKYPDIQFIGISIDQDARRWKNKLEKDGTPARIKELLADPYVVQEAWDLSSIPRFVLIDENFHIINAFAPRPTDKEKLEPMLVR